MDDVHTTGSPLVDELLRLEVPVGSSSGSEGSRSSVQGSAQGERRPGGQFIGVGTG